jgi:hypothetical protein
MDVQNDEAAALAGVAASCKEQSNGIAASVADFKSKSKSEVARPLTGSSLVTDKQAHRIVRAVSRKYPDEARLLGIATPCANVT